MKAPSSAPKNRGNKPPASKTDPIASAIADHARSIDRLAKAVETLAEAIIGSSSPPSVPNFRTLAAEAVQTVIPVALRTISSKRIREEIASFFGHTTLPNQTVLRDLPDRAVAFEATLAKKIRNSDFFKSYGIAFQVTQLRGILTVGELISACQWMAEQLGVSVVD